MVVTLPWPPAVLNPNDRSHWSKKRKVAANYRTACAWIVKAEKPQQQPEGKLILELDFYPPDRRRRDDDNMIAAFKSGRDGIADALGVDDRRFLCRPRVMDEIGGMVKARIYPEALCAIGAV